MAITSCVTEFYGISIPLEDIKKDTILNTVHNCQEQGETPKYFIEDELFRIRKEISGGGMYMNVSEDKNGHYHILLGKSLREVGEDTDFFDLSFEVSKDPQLSDGTLAIMKTFCESIEVDKDFDSYEIKHMIYHTAYGH